MFLEYNINFMYLIVFPIFVILINNLYYQESAKFMKSINLKLNNFFINMVPIFLIIFKQLNEIFLCPKNNNAKKVSFMIIFNINYLVDFKKIIIT